MTDTRVDGPDVWYERVASQRLVAEQRQQGAGALEQPSARCYVMRSHPVPSELCVEMLPAAGAHRDLALARLPTRPASLGRDGPTASDPSRRTLALARRSLASLLLQRARQAAKRQTWALNTDGVNFVDAETTLFDHCSRGSSASVPGVPRTRRRGQTDRTQIRRHSPSDPASVAGGRRSASPSLAGEEPLRGWCW